MAGVELVFIVLLAVVSVYWVSSGKQVVIDQLRLELGKATEQRNALQAIEDSLLAEQSRLKAEIGNRTSAAAKLTEDLQRVREQLRTTFIQLSDTERGAWVYATKVQELANTLHQLSGPYAVTPKQLVPGSSDDTPASTEAVSDAALFAIKYGSSTQGGKRAR
jgi:uncharacterized phage infection (PIP) family protein YhgE